MSNSAKLTFLFLLILSACGQRGDKIVRVLHMKTDFPWEVDSQTLTLGQKTIRDRLKGGQDVSLSDVTREWMVQHQPGIADPTGTDTANEFDDFMAKLSLKTAVDQRRWFDIKPTYEGELEKTSPILYSRDSLSAINVMRKRKVQCFSGTVFFSWVLLREAFIEERAGEGNVVIHESGHVLPGRIEIEQGKPHLFGIETTAAGQAIVEYDAINALAMKVRVVDARLFALSELYKYDFLKPEDVANDMLKRTAMQYGISSPYLLAVGERPRLKTGQDRLNVSIFSFGTSTAPEEATRKRFDRVKRPALGLTPNLAGDVVKYPDAPDARFYDKFPEEREEKHPKRPPGRP